MDHASVVPKIAHQILYDITGRFSTENLVGSGAFGKVYLGEYEDGKKMAVKLINTYTGFNDEQFQNEFKYLSLLEHQNIVRLIGYCQEIQERLVRHKGQWVSQDEMQRALCLEYMPNGSLDKYISVECNKLDWYTAYEIIEGICKGLKYLHEELESPIYHLDLKPANILLDENMTAKIADFGLSRLFGEERTRISQNFKGTFGYLPPEYLEKNEISNKLDIYSLGVIVLKVLAGPEGYTKSTRMTSQQFIEHVHESWRSKLQETPAVAVLKLESYYTQIRKCADIALSCVQADRHKRPTIGGIINALNEIKTRTQISDVSLNSPGSSMNQGNSNSPRKLAFHLLEEMTNSFSEDRKLGSGAFAEVYVGVRKDGAKIAVKMLHPTLGLDDQKFEKEYGNLEHLQHPNIVQLVGYCHETQREYVELNGRRILAEATHRALCFEYMQNGSLDKCLYDEFNGHDWYARYRIIKGICKGLEYLHDELKPAILHMDLKPANILLDEDMLPKVADFGLSRLFGEEQTRITLNSTGTPGYLAPEYVRHNLISKKMDIFSLGVVMIKIMTGPIGYSKVSEMSSQKFIELVQKNWRKRLQATLVDALESYCAQVKICIQIALRCVEVDRHKRPTIGDIVKNLNETETMIEFRNELQNDEWSSGVQNVSRTPMDLDFKTMNYESVVPRSLAFHLLEEMTNGFSKDLLIGSGGYGEVYKATDKNGEVIAVKVLRNIPGLDNAQFEQEYGNLQNLRHQNIVRVVGYCNETRREYVPYEGRNVLADRTHIAICLEYMPRGSLDKYLNDGTTGFNWQTRYGIIKGICKGLKYLHEELRSPIYHLDLKPDNILLDENMIPKISDFGLSRLLVGETTQITMSTIGTLGYVPPEYIERHVISNKFDIFSLGVIIVNIVVGTKGYFRSRDVSSQQFIETEVGNWRKLFAASGYMLESYSEQVQRCLEIAFKCLENDRHKRPSIGDIIHMLNQ